MSTSAANLDYATNNSVAVGDVYRGRAQEKFLSGWKKAGITAAEEIDPTWLVNSMDADSDCGRRVSTACLSRSYHSDIESSVVSNASDQSKSRRRRVGQVSLPGDFPEDSIPAPRHASPKNRHSSPSDFSVTPTPTRDVVDNERAHCISDDQVKQLRLLDRKISMYFGDRNATRNFVLRRTRSFDRIQCDVGECEALLGHSSPASKFPHAITVDSQKLVHNSREGSSNTNAKPQINPCVNVNVGIGIGDDPHFSCAVSNSEVSDIETDSCDFHVSPPVEVVSSTIETAQAEKSNQSTNEPFVVAQQNEIPSTSSSVSFKVEDFPLYFTESRSNSVMAAGEIESIDNKSSKGITTEDDFLTFDVTRNSSSGNSKRERDNAFEVAAIATEKTSLDDESLWNRTEALMSSYQSFNLIRKSTIDPK